ncbi:MAG: NAD(+)/NADH kinase [Phycisphaerales bacterium JB040]
MGRRVVLVVNRRKADAGRAEAAVLSEMRSRGAELVATIDSDSGHEERPAPGEAFDLVVVLGGDGTLLGSARRFHAGGRGDVPLIGINIGKVGFLSQLELDGLAGIAGRLFGDGELPVRTLPRLEARVHDRGASEARAVLSALNDVVVSAGPPFRMIGFGLLLGGSDGPSVSGDGLIASTPVGSTAYNVAAGGPIVAPGVDAYTLTPIAAHSLSFRPIVVPGGVETELSLETVNAGTTLVADGQVPVGLRAGDRVTVSMRGSPARFVVLDGEDYWVTLRRKMRWAERPARRGEG